MNFSRQLWKDASQILVSLWTGLFCVKCCVLTAVDAGTSSYRQFCAFSATLQRARGEPANWKQQLCVPCICVPPAGELKAAEDSPLARSYWARVFFFHLEGFRCSREGETELHPRLAHSWLCAFSVSPVRPQPELGSGNLLPSSPDCGGFVVMALELAR